MKIILANPRGFCAGVSRAVDIVKRVLNYKIKPVYVHHEIVHNQLVVENLRKKGAIFVEKLNEIPNGSVCIFSAHGVSRKVQEEAKRKNLEIYDATCPLVKKVHREVQNASYQGMECILIGHKNHPEVIGTLSQYQNKNSKIHLVESISDLDYLMIRNQKKLVYYTQTTLSIDETSKIIAALKKKYPYIRSPKKKDICYATQNRQNSVRILSKKVDIFIIVGSKNSSNSNRLCELAKLHGIDAYLIDDISLINLSWFNNKKICAITAGASAPEYLVQTIIQFLNYHIQNITIENFEGITENVIFPLPKSLR